MSPNYVNNPRAKATRRQLGRLNWAAKHLGKTVPPNIKKGAAANLIDEWFRDNPALEAGWQQAKKAMPMANLDDDEYVLAIDGVLSQTEDWASMFGCKSISESQAGDVLDYIGERHEGEATDVFMKRFFVCLRMKHPELFTTLPAPKSGCMVIFMCGIFVYILIKVSTL